MGVCPVCGGEMIVSEYSCTECGVLLKGAFRRCDICNLPMGLQHFIRVFLKCEGNIREAEKILGLSYPTVKARLAKINRMLAMEDFSQYVESRDRLGLLEDFKDGKVSIDEVMRKI